MIRRDRGMFTASDDAAMMKQIQATHAPDGRELEVKPILQIIEALLHHVSPGIDGIVNVCFHSSIFALLACLNLIMFSWFIGTDFNVIVMRCLGHTS